MVCEDLINSLSHTLSFSLSLTQTPSLSLLERMELISPELWKKLVFSSISFFRQQIKRQVFNFLQFPLLGRQSHLVRAWEQKARDKLTLTN